MWSDYIIIIYRYNCMYFSDLEMKAAVAELNQDTIE